MAKALVSGFKHLTVKMSTRYTGSNPVLTTKNKMESRLGSSHLLKSCPLEGAYGQKVNIQGSRYWVSHVGNNEPRILV
jgi:hypothetical protein